MFRVNELENLKKQFMRDMEMFEEMEKEWERYFEKNSKKAIYQIQVLDLFQVIDMEVFTNTIRHTIDVSGLVKYIAQPDRELFGEICNFVGRYYMSLPLSKGTLMKFKAMLCYYLVKAGF